MSESRVATIWLALMLTLLISSTLGQVTECTSSPKLRFVAQLTINGCPIFVHDTGANDGPHLAVEPLMCVIQSSPTTKLLPQYDPVTQQTYVSVPVELRHDAILTEVEQQLRHLSPKSVKFATLSAISVSSDNSSEIQALGFDWKPDEPSGVIRIGCESNVGGWCGFKFATNVLSALDAVLHRLTAVAAFEANGKLTSHSYHLVVQHDPIDPNIRAARYSNFVACHQLRFIRSISINNCTVRVHERQDVKRNFLIEPLLCYYIPSFTYKSIMYDIIRNMYYLKIGVVLQDNTVLDMIRSELADLSPLNVTYMRLWRAESVVASALSRRFKIGGLMVSGDWRSGQLRVYCKRIDDCQNLNSSVIKNPSDFWRHVTWTLTSVLSDRILCSPPVSTRYSYEIQAAESVSIPLTFNTFSTIFCPDSSSVCKFIDSRHRRKFLVIQQRLTGKVSFQRGWSEYETGFGDDTDFWIGLSTIHLLSIKGAILRLEMKLWNRTELYAEFAGFKVGDASTNYNLTVGDMIKSSSSRGLDPWFMTHHSGKQFSTLDKQSSSAHPSCFTPHDIRGGWWITNCGTFNPNGNYGIAPATGRPSMAWYAKYKFFDLREVRMLLPIG